jgi:hypothetical protein
MTATVVRLTGDSLVEFVNDKMELVNRGELTRTDMIKDAGYVFDNGKAMYVDFYTELLKAKSLLDPSYVTDRDAEDADYEALSGVQQDLYDSIQDKFGSKWDHEMIKEFMDELDDIGIETPEQLDDSYEYQTDDYNANREFAQYLIVEVMGASIPTVLEGHIDWDSVWDCELRCDYNTIEFDDETFYFRNV